MRFRANLVHSSEEGQVRLALELHRRLGPAAGWTRRKREFALLYAPCSGEMGKRTGRDPVIVESPVFGGSRPSGSRVTRIYIDDRRRMLADVGRVVKREVFPDYPDFVFNTVATVGEHDERGRGGYADPDSVWFNLFAGCYQIDAPKSGWTRPFGYRSPRGVDSEIHVGDMVRLGKADWNWLSNWMYGVPIDEVRRFGSLDLEDLSVSQVVSEPIAGRFWHFIKIENVHLVSAYESRAPGARRLVDNQPLTRLWRRGFGRPVSRDGWPESFIPTRRDFHFWATYWEDTEGFHTFMIGGTAPTGERRDLLSEQLTAARVVLERSYSDLGFKDGPERALAEVDALAVGQ